VISLPTFGGSTSGVIAPETRCTVYYEVRNVACRKFESRWDGILSASHQERIARSTNRNWCLPDPVGLSPVACPMYQKLSGGSGTSCMPSTSRTLIWPVASRSVAWAVRPRCPVVIWERWDALGNRGSPRGLIKEPPTLHQFEHSILFAVMPINPPALRLLVNKCNA
jgi:hypothetical protein